MTSGSTSLSENLVLDDSDEGVIITGITESIAAKKGLQRGDEIVAATIHLDHLNKNEVLSILKILEPYDNNMKVVTKKELSAGAGNGSFGFGLNEIPYPTNGLSLDASADDLGRKLNATQGLGGELRGPTLNGDIPSPKCSADGQFTMPSLGLTGADVEGALDGSLKAPNASLSTPSVLKYNSPKFSMPNFDPPQTNLSQETLKFDSASPKWPHQKWKGPKAKGPGADLSVPGVSLSTPKHDGNIGALDVNCSKAEIKAPEVNHATPVKMSWPHSKWKKPHFHGPHGHQDTSVPKVGGEINTSDGKINWPHLKWKKNISPKVDFDNTDVDTADVNVPISEFGVKAPDTSIEAKSGKTKWPTLKKPTFGTLKASKFDCDAGGPDVSAPNISNDLEGPNFSYSAPKIAGGLDALDCDLSLPKADLEGPDVDVQAPEAGAGKVKIPKLNLSKLFGLSGPRVKGPDIDLDAGAKIPDESLTAPDLNLEAANIKGGIAAPDLELNGPCVDLDAPAKFKMPKWNLGGASAQSGLDADLKTDLSDLDLNGTGDLEAPAKFKMPSLKMPKWNLGGASAQLPDAKLTTPGVSVPDVHLPTADVPTTSLKGGLGADLKTDLPDVKGPNLDLQAPDLNLKAPDVDLNGTGVDFDAPAKLKMPSFKMPKWNFGGASAQSPDAKLTTPGVSVPDVNLPTADVPTTSFKGGLGADLKTDLPDVKGRNLDLQVPDLNLKGPDPSLPSPKIELGLPEAKVEAQNVDANLPEVSLKGRNSGFNSHMGDFKLPFKLPKFGLLKSEVGAPSFEAGIDAPKANIGIAEANMSAAEASLDTETDGCGDELEIPAFRSHRLPRHSSDGSGSIEMFGLSKLVTEDKDYVVSKGIRLPVVNAKSAGGQKIDILERLKMARDKAPSANVTPTDVKTDIDLKLATPSLDAGASTEAGDSSLLRGGTFKVDKLESALGSNENDKMSLGLSNMLGLNVRDSE